MQNAIWPLLLKMEAITKDDKEGIATAAIDFDGICWEVTFQVLDKMGLDQRIWKPMLNFHCTPQEIQQGCGNAGTHVDLHEQHRTGMLSECTGYSGAINGLGKSPGGRSAYSPLQQHCGRSETLCDRKRSAETIAISHPGHERL